MNLGDENFGKKIGNVLALLFTIGVVWLFVLGLWALTQWTVRVF